MNNHAHSEAPRPARRASLFRRLRRRISQRPLILLLSQVLLALGTGLGFAALL